MISALTQKIIAKDRQAFKERLEALRYKLSHERDKTLRENLELNKI